MAERRVGLLALLFPMLVLASATVLDIVRPVSAVGEPLEKESAH